MMKKTQKFHWHQVYDMSNHETTQNWVIMLIQSSSITMHGWNCGSSGSQLPGRKMSESTLSSTQSSSPTLLLSEHHFLHTILIQALHNSNNDELVHWRLIIHSCHIWWVSHNIISYYSMESNLWASTVPW